jgi:hypothetical protein
MSNYYVIPVETDEKDFVWCVMERTTEQLIEAYLFKDDALEYANFLEDGGGFAGWTPGFILQEVAVSRDMNQEFAAFVSE